MRYFFRRLGRKLKSLLRVIWVYSWPLLLAAIYVGLYFLFESGFTDNVFEYPNSVGNRWPLLYDWNGWGFALMDWKEKQVSFLLDVVLVLPILAIFLILLLVEGIWWLITAIISLIYLVLIAILCFIVAIILVYVAPGGLAALSIFLLVRQRADDDLDEPVFSTIVCAFGCILSVLMCIALYITQFV